MRKSINDPPPAISPNPEIALKLIVCMYGYYLRRLTWILSLSIELQFQMNEITNYMCNNNTHAAIFSSRIIVIDKYGLGDQFRAISLYVVPSLANSQSFRNQFNSI